LKVNRVSGCVGAIRRGMSSSQVMNVPDRNDKEQNRQNNPH